jgi:hypothetical protein
MSSHISVSPKQMMLRRGLQEMVAAEGRNSKSFISELAAYYFLSIVYSGIRFVAGENDVEYNFPNSGSLTDFIAQLNGVRYGVSVTRAMTFNQNKQFDSVCARRLLLKKIRCVNNSRNNACIERRVDVFEYQWDQDILFIWSRNVQEMCVLTQELEKIDHGDIHVLVVVADNNWLYT